MPRPLKKNESGAYAYGYPLTYPAYPQKPAKKYAQVYPYDPHVRPKRKRAKKKANPFAALLSFCFLGLTVYYVLPYNYEHFVQPMIVNRFLNKNIEFKAEDYVSPTLNYTSNAELLNRRLLVPVRVKKREMLPLVPSSRMFNLEIKLKELSNSYPHLQPSIYVWDFNSSRSAEINPRVRMSSASIIKLPILVELFRRSEALKVEGESPIDFNSGLLFDEIHKAEGSGYLQYEKTGHTYPIDYLAKIMIQASDNSATNMLLEEIGGAGALNAAARKWGLSSTQITTWLPDLGGTNTVSAEDMAILLYNIDNPKFLSEHSTYMIRQYMSNVHNTRLLKAGLPKNVEIIHKTGDIGTMLGDAGIIYAPNGKKYIAVVLVKRPFNDYSARDYIKSASKIIYNSITKGEL